ncbi:hypothetical protein [Actinosynnema sp. ALI-1.44]|nr:hypothetical protein [Actinosynnema sp. ALI-1.44]
MTWQEDGTRPEYDQQRILAAALTVLDTATTPGAVARIAESYRG